MNVPRRALSCIGVSLLLVAGAACGSDSSTDSTTATTDAATVITGATATTAATATSDASATSEATADSVDDRLDSVPLPTASDDREAIVEYMTNIAEVAGIEFDEQCVEDLIATLSDADAALVADSARLGGEGDPQLSPEGEAIGDQVEDCAIVPTSTS